LINYYQFLDNPIIMVATVLDPRGKLKVYKRTDHPKKYSDLAKEALEKEFTRYQQKVISPERIHGSSSAAPLVTSNSAPATTSHSIFHGLDDSDSESKVPETEVTRYLVQSLAQDNTDILIWWKPHSKEFPILSTMAKDYLAIQCSSKDTEGAFSKGRRQMPYYRERLKGGNFKAQMLVNSGVALGVFQNKN